MDNFDRKLFEMAQTEPVDVPTGLNTRIHSALEGVSDRASRLGRTARTALCALAAAAVLVGTALAVFSAGGFDSVRFWSGAGMSGENFNWYGVEGGDYRRVPVEDLSASVRQMAERNPVTNTTKYFKDSDWSAAQEYSGVALPENPVIDGLEIGVSYLTVSSNEDGPTLLEFWQGTPGLSVTMRAEVYTDLMGEGALRVDRGFPTGELSSEEYVTENCLSALIVHLVPGDAASDSGEDVVDTERYMADFLLDGFRYHIKTEVDGGEIATSEEALTILHDILDGFTP